jgi:DNA repair protein RecO (recombination protein O)
VTYTTTGIILKRRDVGEGDRIYSIYTKDHGKIEAVAQGACKIKSKLAAHLEPLSRGEFMFAAGRRFERLIQARVQENFTPLKNDLKLLGQACFMAEVLDLLTKPSEKDPRIFELLERSFLILKESQQSTNLEQIFTVKLLQFLGFELILDHCVFCKKELVNPLSVTIDALRGGVLCPQCSVNPPFDVILISSLTLEAVKNIFVSVIADLQPLELPEMVSQELKIFANAYLRAHLEFQPKSKDFLDFIYAQ